MDFIVRRMERADLGKLLSLYKYLNPDDQEASQESLAASWDLIMDDRDRWVYFVAEKGEELVASCNLSIIPNLTRGCRSYAVIENVITRPDYRRQGLGRRVMEEAVKYAVEKDCYKVMLMSNKWREEAHRFYESLGFDRNSKIAFEKRF